MPLQPSDTTRSAIKRAAISCFSAQGYKAASVDDICEAANVSKGAFYYHFSSKRALFLALLEDWLKDLEKTMQRMRGATAPATLLKFTGMLPIAFQSAQDRLALGLEFLLEASRDKAVWKATMKPYQHYREIFANLVRQGISEGTLKDVDAEAAAEAILSAAVGLFVRGLLDPRGADWRHVAEESMGILVGGLLVPASTGTKGRRTR